MAFFEDSTHNISLRRTTSGALPRVPFVMLKKYVLGKNYELSVLFPDTQTSIALHKKWKQKSTPVNVLSFPLDDMSGEIVITLATARREAPLYNRSYHDHIVRLYIHGLAHLKGYDHGDAMDDFEERVYNYYQKNLLNSQSR